MAKKIDIGPDLVKDKNRDLRKSIARAFVEAYLDRYPDESRTTMESIEGIANIAAARFTRNAGPETVEAVVEKKE
jgi:hypothetical protein